MSVFISLSLLAGLASMVSAITGVAGGVLLLSGLVLSIPATAVVPIHGLVQFTAGASRMLAFRRHIQWGVVFPFLLTMVPGACVGAYGLSYLFALNPSWLLVLIALVITFTLRPNKQGNKDGKQIAQNDSSSLLFLGFGCGILGMFVGSTGPIVSGWLLKHGILKERHIGSKSVMQGSAHLIKVPLFALGLDFDFSPYAMPLMGMMLMVLVGTWFGKWCLNRVAPQTFALMTRCILIIIAVKIFITEIPKLL